MHYILLGAGRSSAGEQMEYIHFPGPLTENVEILSFLTNEKDYNSNSEQCPKCIILLAK